MLCKFCGKPMKHSIRGKEGKIYDIYKCPKCYAETKPALILMFNEEKSKIKGTTINKNNRMQNNNKKGANNKNVQCVYHNAKKFKKT